MVRSKDLRDLMDEARRMNQRDGERERYILDLVGTGPRRRAADCSTAVSVSFYRFSHWIVIGSLAGLCRDHGEHRLFDRWKSGEVKVKKMRRKVLLRLARLIALEPASVIWLDGK